MINRLVHILTTAAAFAIVCSAQAKVPVDQLLDGVHAIKTGGNPASLIVWGRKAEALVAGPDGTIYAAASELSRGRVVVVGHGGFVSTTDSDSEIFVANALPWLAGSAVRRSRRPIRVHGLSDAILPELHRREMAFEQNEASVKDLVFDDVDVIIGSPQRFAKAGRLEDLDRWLRAGGGMLVTETAWGVMQLDRTLTVDTLAANTMLEAAGVRFTSSAHSGFGPHGTYPVDRTLLSLANANTALLVLSGVREGDGVFAAQVLGKAVSSVPLDARLITDAKQIAARHRTRLHGVYRGLDSKRIKVEDDPLARAMIDLDSRFAMELPAQQVRPHPSSEAFPGPVGSTLAGRVRLELDASVPGWHSTGLYAPPGRVVQVAIHHSATDVGINVQIGAWRDPHNHTHRVRLKNALRRYPIESPIVYTASAIGGPIYIDLPRELATTLKRPMVALEITGAVRAPHYKHDETDLDAWRDTIRHYEAPWAEMESDELVLTVPSSAIRELDRPDLVMDHWDRVHAAMQSLEPRTENHWADRPYRYVADVSVSWGYMYCPANGPVVIPAKAAAAMFDLENFDDEGPNKLWGHYHEMGHAHQNRMWTDSATTEVTVNIFTVYALHTVNGYPLDADVMRTTPRTAWETFAAHRGSGRAYEDVGGAFPRLQMYALLWHAFDFEAFHETFDTIRALPESEQPNGTDAERNTFVIHFSRAVGRNLVPYFEAWGITVTDDARRAVGHLPGWMPSEPAVPGE